MFHWLANIRKAVSIAVIITAIVTALPAGAATVTSANDYPSSLEAAANADHTLVFTTPSGVAEGDTIVIGFDAAFDLASITEDDVDLEDDGIDLTTATDCSGAEQASVSVAGSSITLTICSGDGGSIAGGSEITIEVGSHASASGTGTNQIQNPSSVGTYYVSLEGTFGDSGSIALPIVTDNTIAVVAEVDNGGGGGPGDGGGCGDTTDPIISNVTVSGLTATSAQISWNTDESADGKVDYGLTEAYELGTNTDSSLVTARTINLTGLTEGIEYHFRVRSADLCVNESASGDFTFTTPDETACVNSNIDVIDIGTSTARVIWTTNEPATSQVDYGTTISYGMTASDGTFVTDHSIILASLAEGTTYHYRVSCEDASGNVGISADDTFTTDEDVAPANVSGLEATAGDARCDLSWTLPVEDDLAGVVGLVCLDTYPSSEADPDCTEIFDLFAESFAHTGLVNDTTYYYGVFAYDDVGQFASGALDACTPSAPEEELPPEEIPPEEVPPEEPPPDDGAGYCGDGTCSPLESSVSCPADCPVEEPDLPDETGPTCGNAVCEAEENSEVCPSDCVAEEIPPTTVEDGELIPPNDVSFLVNGGALSLPVDEEGRVEMVAGSTVEVILDTTHVTKEIERVELFFGSGLYLLAPGNGSYSATIRVPETEADYAIAIAVFYKDGTTQSLPFTGAVVPPGYTYELLEGEEVRVGNTRVTLLQPDGAVWDASPFAQSNPVTTGGDGSFFWYVPNGDYLVRATHEGYEEKTISVTAVNAIVNSRILLIPIEEPFVPAPVVTNLTEAIESVQETIEAVRENPTVQASADVAKPLLVATAVATTAILAASFNLLAFLQYLFTSPFLLFWKRKRKGFGVVYNSLTKLPIDLAIVRLIKLPENRLIRSRVTDKGGRYFFLVDEGEYRLTVSKPGFVFPTTYLGRVKDDGAFLDVYHGETIKVTEKSVTITPNIPLDSTAAEKAQHPQHVTRNKFLRKLQGFVAVSGVLISLLVLLVQPSLFAAAMVGVQVAVYALVRRLAKPRKPKNWGIVYDKTTNRPLGNVVVRVFEPKYNKLLETSVTDGLGRYSFLLGPSEYYTTYVKPGYETVEVRPIDYTKESDAKELAVDIQLNPDSGKQTPPGTSEGSDSRT